MAGASRMDVLENLLDEQCSDLAFRTGQDESFWRAVLTADGPQPREVELYPHQQKAVEDLDNGKILLGGVGSGKSRTAAAYYMANESLRDVVVITTAKKRDSHDWEEEFVKFGVGKERDATLAGILTVDSWNNLGRYENDRDKFFVFDEQRLVGSGAWTKSFLKIAKSNHWILLSATPGDTWLDYIPVFIANGFFKNRTEFKREHVIYNTFSKFPKVERYVGVNKLVRLRNSILVKMLYQNHTVRRTHYIPVDYDKEKFKKAVVQRWHVYEERPIRDVAELFSVMRKIVNSDPSRLEAVKCLMKKHPKLIIFYNFDYELMFLRDLLTSAVSATSHDESSKSIEQLSQPSSDSTDSSIRNITTSASTSTAGSRSTNLNVTDGCMIAEWNGHKHEEIPKTDRWVYLVQYVAGSEGWNCTETDAMVFWSLTYSYKNWHQAYGRIDRLNTPYKYLDYYVLRSNSQIDGAIMQSLKLKKSFNESSMGIKF